MVNLKFVSKGDQRFEAVYNKTRNLLTEGNDEVNMGTYNYAGPSDVSGHVKYDVEPYYKWGNTANLSEKGAVAELAAAGANMTQLWFNTDAINHYNKYALQFGLDEIYPDMAPSDPVA